MDMPFLKLLPYFLLLTTSFKLASSEVHVPAYYDHNCTIDKNFTSNSPYQFNLNTLLKSLYSMAAFNDSPPEFYNTNTTAGIDADDDAAYGEYMCRGDVPMDVCKNCVQDATSRIASECPNSKEAIIWYDQCSVCYSNSSFFSILRQLPTVNSSLQGMGRLLGVKCSKGARYTSCLTPRHLMQRRTGANLSKAYIVLNKTLNDAVAEAAAVTSSGTKKFATKEANLSSSESVYTLVQCTPDLSPRFCSECLYGMMERIPKENTSGSGRILNPSCNLRFATQQFYYKGNQPPYYTSEEYGRPSLYDWNCSTTEANDAYLNDPDNLYHRDRYHGDPVNNLSNHAYLNNLSNLFDNLSFSSNITENKGFYTTIVGNKFHTFYGLFMCRGDVPLELCHECVNEGIQELNSTCSSSKEAIVWYDMCMLRYSNLSFFSTLDTQPIYTKCDGVILDNQQARFNMLLTNTLNDLVEATPKSVGVKNFETKNVSSSSELKTLYALAQCTPNLSSHDCRKCLDGALEHVKSKCLGNNGGQVMNPSCNLRFSTYRFYNDSKSKTSVSVPPTYPPTPEGKDNERTLKIVVSVAVVLIMLFCFAFYYWKRKNNESYKAILKKIFGSEGATLESLQFGLAAIEAATDKFSIENRIGKGGFGEVYMGILPDGSKIAVKRLSEHSRQGLLEFKNEVLLIAKLQHRNLVALLGFCLKDQEKLLIYEYVPNKSLDYFLFGAQKQRVLNWQERYKITGGIA